MAGKRSPLLKEEYLEAIRRFRPIDDTFMRCMFRDCDEVAETYGFPTASIVNMAEVTQYLHNRPLEGKVVIDDAMKEAIDAYYQQWGARQ